LGKRRRWVKRFKWIILTIVAITLAKCGYDEMVYGDTTPQVNPHPTKKVRIHGKFPFDSDIKLEGIQAIYINDNSKCNKVAKSFGIIPAAEVALYEEVNIAVKRLPNNEYEAYYYQDYFLPGACKWRFDGFQNRVKTQVRTIGLNFLIFGGYLDTYYGFAKGYKAEHYEFSNKLTYECGIYNVIYKRQNIPPGKILDCESIKTNNDKWISLYQDATDVEQNFIYKKGVTRIWE
jgi:hypothetical protein